MVPLRVKVADLEAARKAEASKVERIEKRSADGEILLGKVEADRDKALAELSQTREEATKVALGSKLLWSKCHANFLSSTFPCCRSATKWWMGRLYLLKTNCLSPSTLL